MGIPFLSSVALYGTHPARGVVKCAVRDLATARPLEKHRTPIGELGPTRPTSHDEVEPRPSLFQGGAKTAPLALKGALRKGSS